MCFALHAPPCKTRGRYRFLSIQQCVGSPAINDFTDYIINNIVRYDYTETWPQNTPSYPIPPIFGFFLKNRLNFKQLIRYVGLPCTMYLRQLQKNIGYLPETKLSYNFVRNPNGGTVHILTHEVAMCEMLRCMLYSVNHPPLVIVHGLLHPLI